jgi:hypothetical protein
MKSYESVPDRAAQIALAPIYLAVRVQVIRRIGGRKSHSGISPKSMFAVAAVKGALPKSQGRMR